MTSARCRDSVRTDSAARDADMRPTCIKKPMISRIKCPWMLASEIPLATNSLTRVDLVKKIMAEIPFLPEALKVCSPKAYTFQLDQGISLLYLHQNPSLDARRATSK